MDELQRYLDPYVDKEVLSSLCTALQNAKYSVTMLKVLPNEVLLKEVAVQVKEHVEMPSTTIGCCLIAAKAPSGAGPGPGSSEERGVPGELGQFDGGPSSAAVGTLAASLRSVVDDKFGAVMEALGKLMPKKEEKSFSSVSDATGYKVLTKLGYTVVDGNKVDPVILREAKSVAPFEVEREEAKTRAFLTEFQNLLQQQGVTLGPGGFEVVDTHARPEALMPLNVVAASFKGRGRLDGVVVPYGNLLYVQSMRLGVELKRGEIVPSWAKKRKVSGEGGEGSAAGADGAGVSDAQTSIQGQPTLEVLAAHVYSQHPVDLVLTNGKWYMVYRLRCHDGVKKLIVWRFGDSNEDRAKAYQLIGDYLKNHALVTSYCTPADIESKPALAAGAPILKFMRSFESPDAMEDQADVLLTGPEGDFEERLLSAFEMVRTWGLGEALGAVLPQPPESPGNLSYFS